MDEIYKVKVCKYCKSFGEKCHPKLQVKVPREELIIYKCENFIKKLDYK